MVGKARYISRTPPDNRTKEHTFNFGSGFSADNNQNSSPTTITNSNFLKSKGSVLAGIQGALRHSIAIVSGVLDITNDGTNDLFPRSIIKITAQSGTTDTLDTIEWKGREVQGAVITLIGTDGDTITITHGASVSGTLVTIHCPNDADVILHDDGVMDLIYDSVADVWRIMDSTSSATGTYLTASLAADHTNASATEHVEFDTKDEDGGIVLQTGSGQSDGIFELLKGKIYYLEGVVRPEFSGATGACVMVWYDITNTAEIGSRAIYEAMDHTGNDANQPVASAIVTPSTNITVELRVISETVLDAFANEYTHANLFELGGGGSGSGGGVSFPITPTINDHGNVGTTTEDLDLSASDGHIHKITLTGNPTLTFSNPPSSGTQIEFEVEFIQDNTGNRTVTYPSEVIETIRISPVADAITIVTFRTNDGGTTYHAIPALRGTINLSGSGNFASKSLDNISNTLVSASLIPSTDDNLDLGSASKEWGDLYIDGTANIDTLSATTLSGQMNAANNSIVDINQVQITGSSGDVVHGFVTGQTGILEITSDANSSQIRLITRDTGGGLTTKISVKETEILFENPIKLNSVDELGSSDYGLYRSVSGTHLNAPTGKLIILGVNGTANHKVSIASTSWGGTAGDDMQLFCVSDGSDAPINIEPVAGDPSSQANGDIWYNSTSNKLLARINGGDVDLGATVTAAATTELDNLGTVAINTSLISDTNNQDDLGSASKEWKDLYIDGTANIDTLSCTVSATLPSTTMTGQIDLANNTVFDINQVQITGTSGDTVRGFLSGTSGVFNVVSNENSSQINLVTRDTGGSTTTKIAIKETTIDFDNPLIFTSVDTAGSTDYAVFRSSNGIHLNAPSGKLIILEIAGGGEISIGGSSWGPGNIGDDMRLFLTSSGNKAPLNLEDRAGNPSNLSDGDMWYNSTTNKFRGRANGVSVDLH